MSSGVRVSLLLLVLAAPISIAATQTAWAFALLFWLIRAVLSGRTGNIRSLLKNEALSLSVLVFVGLTFVSSVLSYEPEVSLRKMVAVSLVTIVFLVAEAAKDRRFLQSAVVILLAACFASCIYTFTTQAIGKNLKIVRLSSDSPLRPYGVDEGDTILTIGGKQINSVQDLKTEIGKYPNGAGLPLVIYRQELLLRSALPVSSALLPSSDTDFGILEWSRGRDTRAAGFYGHYTTFAEVLQLIGSLALGLLIFLPGGPFAKRRILLALVFASISLALFLTVTRASWVGLGISAAVMILFAARRRTILICIVVAIPLVIGGLYYLKQKRNVTFIDTSDGSTTWRMTVWREGFGVLISEPRHLAVGIGMDSLKTHWRDWHMFENGQLPMGHLHSTPLQIAFERGVPALIAWIVWMFLLLRMLIRGIRAKGYDWFKSGVLLGCFGGIVGFLAGGLVHYNWGDSEVVMVLYILMGLSLAVSRSRTKHDGETTYDEAPSPVNQTA